jgi:Protein of unknown function (DUF3096)
LKHEHNLDCALLINNLRGHKMRIDLHLQPVVALIAGKLILIAPRLLSWIVGIYLVVIGVLGLMGR